DSAISFIRKSIDQHKPFYVQLHYHAVHDSLHYKAPDKYFDKFNSTSYDLNNFYAHLYAVDQNLKKIVDSLKSKGVYENTLIIFTSDNGAQSHGPSVLPGNAPWPGHKGTYYQGGIRVPLFFHWPAQIRDIRSLEIISSTMDIIPTAIAASGGEIPSGIDGQSLLDQVVGISDKPVRDHLIWAGLHSRAWGFWLSTTFKGHGGERNFAPPAWVVVKDNYILRFVGEIEPDLYTEIPEGGLPAIRLYNYEADPGETNNLSAQLPEKVKEMSQLYFAEAVDFPPPVVWRQDKWAEIVPDSNQYLNPKIRIELQ
ncbi:MAG: sulfatase family protein, partial [Cyclobacteriaceae bacterium]